MLPRKDGQRLQSAQCPSNASAHQVMPLLKSLRPLMVSLYWLDKHRHIVRQREFFADEAYIAIDELVAQGHIRALEHRVKGGRGVSAGLHFHGNESTLALNHEVDLAQLRGFLVVVGRVTSRDELLGDGILVETTLGEAAQGVIEDLLFRPEAHHRRKKTDICEVHLEGIAAPIDAQRHSGFGGVEALNG